MSYTKGELVANVLNILGEYDVDAEDCGMQVAAEIEERIPLIAAAPKLLEACKEILPLVEECQREAVERFRIEPERTKYYKPIKNAEAAIAEAEKA